MVFCSACGKSIHETAQHCPGCGAVQHTAALHANDIPDGVKGWSWGAFFLNWIWAIGNKTWIGLIALIPYVGFIMALVLGFKGREWAWKNQQWDSVEHFNRVQKKWSFWAVTIFLVAVVLGLAGGIAAAVYENYTERQSTAAATAVLEQTPEPSPEPTAPTEPLHEAQIAPAVATRYEQLPISDSDIGGIFTSGYSSTDHIPVLAYVSSQGPINLLETVLDDLEASGYVSVAKAYAFGNKYLFIISTGEHGRSCDATTYAFSFDRAQEQVSGKALIDGCSETVESFSEGNKLTVKKEGAVSVFFNGEVKPQQSI